MNNKSKEILLKKTERIDDLNIDGMKLIQNTEYFLFGMDSVLLSSIVKSSNKNNIILDLCTGSAVIPILLSTRVSFTKILGVELQKEMYDLAIRNLELNGLNNKVEIIDADIKNYKIIGEYIKERYNKENVDVIVCNPPYKEVGTGVLNEHDVKYNARHETLCRLEDVLKTASKLLKSKGRLYLVHKPERLADLITIAREYNLEIKEFTMMQPKEGSRPSILLIEYVKDGGNECKIMPVITEYDDSGNYTKRIKDIYRM